MRSLEQRLAARLDARRRQNAFRQLRTSNSGVDFCSNDYLGYAKISFPASEREGATGSRLITGNSALAEKLEKELADFHGSEASLLFTSGYAANLGLLSCTVDRGDTILYDELVHASIREGILLARSRAYAFRHNDLASLRRKLKHTTGQVFIVVESIYSMDGDESPLAEIAEAAREAGAALIVDEAHATGVIGPQGRGLVSELGLEEEVWARVHTFGKSLGAHGAAVLGSMQLRQFLINFCRPFIYTTALPDSVLHRIYAAYQLLKEDRRSIRRLRENIAYFKAQLSAEAVRCFIPSRSPIQCLVLPGNDRVKRLADQLQGEGLYVLPILHPTVRKGAERLRICLHADNTKADIDRLCLLLNELTQQIETFRS